MPSIGPALGSYAPNAVILLGDARKMRCPIPTAMARYANRVLTPQPPPQTMSNDELEKIAAAAFEPVKGIDPSRLAQLEALEKLVLEWRRAERAFWLVHPLDGARVTRTARKRVDEAEARLKVAADQLLTQRKEGV